MTATRPPDDDLDLDALDAVRIKLDNTIREQKRAGYGAPKERRLKLPHIEAPDLIGAVGIVLVAVGLAMAISIAVSMLVVGVLWLVMALLLGRAENMEGRR